MTDKKEITMKCRYKEGVNRKVSVPWGMACEECQAAGDGVKCTCGVAYSMVGKQDREQGNENSS